jgi:hypothetical protein
MLNTFTAREIGLHKLVFTTTEGREVHLLQAEFDYEIKWMNEAVVGYPYVILAGKESPYGYALRYEVQSYKIIKL